MVATLNWLLIDDIDHWLIMPEYVHVLEKKGRSKSSSAD